MKKIIVLFILISQTLPAFALFGTKLRAPTRDEDGARMIELNAASNYFGNLIGPQTAVYGTNLTRLFIVEYPQQSNGELEGTPSIFPTNWFSGLPYSTLDSWHNGDAYSGTNKVLRSSVDGGAGWGSEVGAEISIHALLEKDLPLHFVRYGLGGQPITTFEKGTTNYTQMLELVQSVRTNYLSGTGNPDVLVFGRNETGDMSYTQITNIVADLRADLSNSTLRIVYQGRNSMWPDYTNAVDQALMQAANDDPLGVYTDAKFWERKDTNTNVHYDQYGHLEKGMSIGSAIARLFSGTKAKENLNIRVAGIDKAGINQATIAQAKMGNAEVRGKLTLGELEMEGASIANGIVTGVINDQAKTLAPFYVTRYLPFESQSTVTDPVNGGSYTLNGDAALEFDSTRNNGIMNFTAYEDTNNITMPDTTLQDNWSISVWVKVPSTPNVQYIMGKNSIGGVVSFYLNANGASCSIWMRNTDSSTNEYFNMYYGTLLPSGIEIDTWTHLAVGVAYTNFQLYVNGVASPGTQSITGMGPGTVPRDECIFNRLGYSLTSGYDCDIKIDEFLFMNGYTIDATDAASLFSRQQNGDSNIKGYR